LGAAFEEGIVNMELITWSRNDDEPLEDWVLEAAEHQPLRNRFSASNLLGYLFCLAFFALGLLISSKLAPFSPSSSSSKNL
jgi:hypothetical protein